MIASSEAGSLYFFSTDVRFQPRSGDEMESKAVEALLHGNARRRRMERIRCLWSAAARLRRARALLRQVLAGDLSEHLLSNLDYEWRALAHSGGVRKILAQAADRAAAGAVLVAVEDELLPLVRLRNALLARERGVADAAREQLLALRQWQVPRDRAGAFATIYGGFLTALVDETLPLDSSVSENVARILSVTSSDEVAEPYVALISRHLGEEKLAAGADTYIGQLAQVVEQAIPRTDLLRLLSSAYTASGVRDINTFTSAAAGIHRLAKARLFDPLSAAPEACMKEATEVLRKHQSEYERARKTMAPSATPYFDSLIASFGTALKHAHQFGETSEGLSIRARWNDAITRGAARSLAWGDDREALSRARIVVNAIDEAFAGKTPPALHDGFANARTIAERDGVDAGSVPWAVLEESFEQNGVTSGDAVPFVIGPAYVPPRTELGAIVRQQAETLAEERGSESAAGSTEVWLFSPRDWLWKTVAVAGMVMVGHVSVATTAASIHDRRVDRLYGEVRGAAGKDDARVLASAPELLASMDTNDRRLSEVAALYRDTVFRKIINLSRQGQTQRVHELLTQYREVASALPIRASLNN